MERDPLETWKRSIESLAEQDLRYSRKYFTQENMGDAIRYWNSAKMYIEECLDGEVSQVLKTGLSRLEKDIISSEEYESDENLKSLYSIGHKYLDIFP